MGKNIKRGFKWRGLATFLLTLGMLVEIVSGIILYITPPGRFAYWTNWTLWGLSKGDWRAVHTIFGYLLLIIIGMHLYFNWRIIVHFFWNKVRSTFNLKWEFAVSALIIVFIFAGTLWYIPPFSTIMDFGARAKQSWEKNSGLASTRGKGRWAQSLRGSGEFMNQKGRGKGYVSSIENNDSSSSLYENEGFVMPRRGNRRWAKNRTDPRHNSAYYSAERGRNCERTSE